MEYDQHLRALLSLEFEAGQAYIREHAASLLDQAAFGTLLKDESLRQRGIEPASALKLAELLIFFGDVAQHPSSHALGYIAKGDALAAFTFHRYQAALACLEQAGEEFLALGDEVGWARSRVSWIVCCAWLGRIEEALREGERAHEAFMRHGEYYRACTIDHNMAVIYTQRGQYQRALELYERMLTVYPTLRNLPEPMIQSAIALAHYNQARNFSWLGDFARAYELMLHSQASFLALGEHGQVIEAEINLADFDYAQGYYGSALRHYYQARDSLVEQHLDDPVRFVWFTLRIALCLVKLNRAEEAYQLAAGVVEALRANESPLAAGEMLNEYAAILSASEHLAEALEALKEAEQIFAHEGLAHNASITRLQQAEILLRLGEFEEAYRQARELAASFTEQGLVARSVRAQLVMAESQVRQLPEMEAAQAEALLPEATALSQRVSRLARQHNLQEPVYQSQYLLGRLAMLQGDEQRASRHYSLAIGQIERILDNLVSDLGPSFLRTTWQVYEEMIALCLRLKHVQRAFGYLERARSMALRQARASSQASERVEAGLSAEQSGSVSVLRTRHELEHWQQRYHQYSLLLADLGSEPAPEQDQEALQAELKRCEAKLSELFERLHLHQLELPPPGAEYRRGASSLHQFDITRLQQNLLPDQLLLAYYLHQGKLVIFAVTDQRLVTHEQADGAAQVERLLLLLHAHLQPQVWSDVRQPPQQAIRRLLQKLYALLLAPVAAYLPPVGGYLTIVPYGSLHNLPFQALYDGSRFLVEDYQIHYLPACSLLAPIASQEEVEETREVRSPLVLGFSGNGQLQRALVESSVLAELLGGRCYLEKEATIARLIEAAPGSPIIHLATHGRSRLDAPNFSYVRLADGQLNAIDAFRLDLRRCALVTLSGCETGLALSGGGDEQLGLGRAFLAAGAASLVMSLWPVEDQATSELMLLFYQCLLKGDTRVQALRAAQCALLHGENPAYAHPYFWASFRLVGEAGEL